MKGQQQLQTKAKPMSHSVQSATQSDWTAISAMIESIQRHEQELLGYPLLAPETMSKDYLARAQQRLTDHAGETLVCKLDAEIIGCLLGCMDTDDDLAVDRGFRKHALIMDIYVVPEMRKQGVATALIDVFSQKMKSKGCAWLRVWAKSQNRTAIEAYLRYGFEPYESIFVKQL